MQSRVIRWTVLAALSAVVGLAYAEDKDTKGRDAKETRKAKVGEAAPDFTLTDCCGKEHTLSDHKDKIVVLEWVNQQCPYSIGNVETIRKVHKKYADKKNIVWMGIESTHWRTSEENKKYIKDQKLPYTILMDNDGEVGRLYGARTTPHIYVINKGELVYAGALHDDPRGRKKESEVRNYLDQTLAAILADKDVPVAETKPWGCSVKYAAEDKKKASSKKK